MGIFGKSKKKVKKQQEKTAEKSTGTVDAGLTSKNKVPSAKEAREGPPKATRYYADSKERTSSKKSQPDGATTPTRNSSKKGKGSSEAPRAAPPPSAREAAFAGPPRFDWIDVVSEVPCRAVPYHTRDWRWNVILDSKLLAFEILTFFSSWKSIVCLFVWFGLQETNAATKIQSIVRRKQVMDTLEAKGKSTAAIRNRRRRRKAAKRKTNQGYKVVSLNDPSSYIRCCAMGMAFGDDDEDDAAYRQLQKKQYEERKKQQALHEAALRKRYMKEHGGGNTKVIEAVEVVS